MLIIGISHESSFRSLDFKVDSIRPNFHFNFKTKLRLCNNLPGMWTECKLDFYKQLDRPSCHDKLSTANDIYHSISGTYVRVSAVWTLTVT